MEEVQHQYSDNLRKIYDKSVKELGLTDSYEQFSQYFNASDENRRKVYDKAVSAFGLTDSYEDFLNYAGYTPRVDVSDVDAQQQPQATAMESPANGTEQTDIPTVTMEQVEAAEEQPKPAWMPNRMGGVGGEQNYFPNQTSVNLQQSIAKRKEWEAYSQTAEAKAVREEQKNIRQQAIDEIDEKSERGFMGFLNRLGAGMVNDPYGMYTKENGAIVSELTEKSVEDAKYQDARRKLKKSLKEIKGEDWRADGTMRGLALARGIALADYESMAPLASASDAFSELDLALKIRDGKELTDADKTLLQAKLKEWTDEFNENNPEN
jgi:hypothetical protein